MVLGRPCLFRLFRVCRVYELLSRYHPERKHEIDEKWGSPEWVKLYCAMCVKATYARAKNESYRLINTL